MPLEEQTISAEARAAAYPELTPLPPLVQKASQDTANVDTRQFQSRVDQLRQKSNTLKGRSVIDAQTRLKMMGALERKS